MTEQLKALAEAVVNNKIIGESWAHEANFQFYATPERILTLFAENERADKLLQQALEALDNSVDVVREEYTEAVRRYSGLPSRKARLDSLNALLTKHESSITDIRTYLENKNA